MGTRLIFKNADFSTIGNIEEPIYETVAECNILEKSYLQNKNAVTRIWEPITNNCNTGYFYVTIERLSNCSFRYIDLMHNMVEDYYGGNYPIGMYSDTQTTDAFYKYNTVNKTLEKIVDNPLLINGSIMDMGKTVTLGDNDRIAICYANDDSGTERRINLLLFTYEDEFLQSEDKFYTFAYINQSGEYIFDPDAHQEAWYTNKLLWRVY